MPRLLQVVPDAPWLPPGGRAETWLCDVAPSPAGMVRLLILRQGRVFCLPREGSGRLDLPTAPVRVGPGAPVGNDDGADDDGAAAARALQLAVTGNDGAPTPVGFVRNVVAPGALDYPWPTPHAHFTLWRGQGEPVVPGTWVDLATEADVLADRHWFAVVAALG